MQAVVGVPSAEMEVENAKRKVGTPSTETSAGSSPAPARVLEQKQKNDEGEMKPRAVFQDDAELLTEEAYMKKHAEDTGTAAASSRAASSTDKHMKQESEPERMVMLKSLMAHQTMEFKSAVGAQGKRIADVEKLITANERKAEGRFAKVEARIGAQCWASTALARSFREDSKPQDGFTPRPHG